MAEQKEEIEANKEEVEQKKEMILATDIFNWMSKKKEFSIDKFKNRFKIDTDAISEIIKLLSIEGLISETKKDNFEVSEVLTLISENQRPKQEEIIICMSEFLRDIPNIQGLDDVPDNLEWDELMHIDKFTIYDGAERIYEIQFRGKIIRLEGKELLDFNIFRLRLCEQIGYLLPTMKGVAQIWAQIVSHWHRNYTNYVKDKVEVISEVQILKESILDYINNAVVSETFVVKNGFIVVKKKCIYVPSRAIQKIIKKEDIKITPRKLSYYLKEYLVGGTEKYKVDKKSERFWRFDLDKFDIDTEKAIKFDFNAKEEGDEENG